MAGSTAAGRPTWWWRGSWAFYIRIHRRQEGKGVVGPGLSFWNLTTQPQCLRRLHSLMSLCGISWLILEHRHLSVFTSKMRRVIPLDTLKVWSCSTLASVPIMGKFVETRIRYACTWWHSVRDNSFYFLPWCRFQVILAGKSIATYCCTPL